MLLINLKESKMKPQTKVKLIIFCAIVVVIALFLINIGQIIAIHNKDKTILSQQQQIEQLTQKSDYFENHDTDPGEKEIVPGGED